jgi:curved DNA-binding protein CbpA
MTRLLGLPQEDWDILGVHPGASPEDIKTAYRRKARQHHPDHGGSDEMMKQINAAKVALLGD